MKVAILVSSLENGGSERVAVALSSWLQTAGHDVAVITWSSSVSDFYQVPEGVRRIGLNISGISGNSIAALIANLKRVFHLRNAISSLSPEYVISLGSTANILAVMSTIFLGAKIVISDRINPYDAPLTGVWKFLQFIFYRFAYMAIAQSRIAEKWIKENYPKLPTQVIGNASSICPKDLAIRVIDDKEPTQILFVGRLVRQKGVDVLLNALSIIDKSFGREFHCSIVGDGPERHNLVMMANSLGLNHRVSFFGRSSEVSVHYSKADIFVLPSRYEGFPNTLIEAMTFGLPVVASACGAGVADVLSADYMAGLQFSTENSAECALAINALMEDEELRSKLKSNAIRRSKDYSEAVISKQWLDIIK